MKLDKKGLWFSFSSYVLWGILPIFWAALGEVDSLYLLATRIAWSVVFYLLILLVTRELGAIKAVFADRKQLPLLLGAGIAVTINWGLYIYSVNSGHVLDASLAYYMNPLISVVMGAVVFRESVNRLQWTAVGIALSGVLVTVICYGTIPYLALIISCSFATYGLLKKQVACNSILSGLVEALFVLPPALLYLFYAEASGFGGLTVLPAAKWVLLPLSGVITAIPLLLYSSGVKRIPLSISGMLMYINPTLQMLMGILLFHETFDLPRLIMFCFVWAGLALFLSADRMKRKAALSHAADEALEENAG